MDASDDACRAQLSQEHHGTEFSIAFLLHTFMETHRKWSTAEGQGQGQQMESGTCHIQYHFQMDFWS